MEEGITLNKRSQSCLCFTPQDPLGGPGPKCSGICLLRDYWWIMTWYILHFRWLSSVKWTEIKRGVEGSRRRPVELEDSTMGMCP